MADSIPSPAIPSPGPSRNLSRRNSVNFNVKSSKVSEVLATNVVQVEGKKDYLETVRIELKKALTNSWFGIYYENFLVMVSVGSCLEYIYNTYIDRASIQHRRLQFTELGFASAFLLDWTFNFFLADHKLTYVVR